MLPISSLQIFHYLQDMRAVLMIDLQGESLSKTRNNRLKEETGKLRWDFLLVSQQRLKDLCLWANDSNIVIQVFDIKLKFSKESKSFHDFMVVGDGFKDFTVCFFTE